jgi:hypothetical protein
MPTKSKFLLSIPIVEKVLLQLRAPQPQNKHATNVSSLAFPATVAIRVPSVSNGNAAAHT